jgi:hypothetical protein
MTDADFRIPFSCDCDNPRERLAVDENGYYNRWCRCLSEPGPEAHASFAAWWLADLAERYPGRRFRLVPRDDAR